MIWNYIIKCSKIFYSKYCYTRFYCSNFGAFYVYYERYSAIHKDVSKFILSDTSLGIGSSPSMKLNISTSLIIVSK